MRVIQSAHNVLTFSSDDTEVVHIAIREYD